jgi:UDP-glucose 4-epimerase
VYASTIWVYSDVDAELVDEDAPLRPPRHLYTATKLTGELYCHAYHELYGLDSVILRFGIPYGPRARPEAVVPAMVGRALAGEPLTVAGDGTQTRRFVYVEDLADGVVRALAPGVANRTYNLVGARDVSIREVAETVRDLVGDVEIAYVPGRTGDFRGAEVDGSRAARELGWTPTTEFADGVRQYVRWLEREAPAAPRRRVTEALPGLRHVVAPVGFVGALAAVLAAAGSVDGVVDEAPVAAEVMAMALPLALVSRMQRGAAATRRLGATLVAIACVLTCWLLLPLPGGGAVHDHRVVALLMAVSTATAGILAGGPSLRMRAGG